jgi:hypothetical protein
MSYEAVVYTIGQMLGLYNRPESRRGCLFRCHIHELDSTLARRPRIAMALEQQRRQGLSSDGVLA